MMRTIVVGIAQSHSVVIRRTTTTIASGKQTTSRTSTCCFSTSFQTTNSLKKPDPTVVDIRYAPSDFTTNCAVVYRDVISSEEGELLVQDITSRMKRRRYEKGHWDAVITNYKEVELSDTLMVEQNPDILPIFQRIRNHLEVNHLLLRIDDDNHTNNNGIDDDDRNNNKNNDGNEKDDPIPSSESNTIQWLPAHAIDLKVGGELNAHVDSVKFSGGLVAGLSLLSSSIMRLAPSQDGIPEGEEEVGEGHVDLYLPPLSLYALTGVGRYRYSHELLPDQSIFTSSNGESFPVSRDHRLSIIFRDAKRNE